MREKIAANHAEENTGVILIKVINLRLDMMDVLTSFENYFGTEPQLRQAIHGPCHQHDAPLRGQSGGEYSQGGNDRNSFFFQAEDGIRDLTVTGVQTCALPI